MKKNQSSSLPSISSVTTPTLSLLLEHRFLSVINPKTGFQFQISLRDWQGLLFAIQVRPKALRPSDWDNPYVTAHRLINRATLETWLRQLRVP